jgi:hypothetical protein
VSSLSVNQARARRAGLSRGQHPDPERIRAAKRDLEAAKLEAYVQRVVAEAPPLTQEQASRIAGLLRGGTA